MHLNTWQAKVKLKMHSAFHNFGGHRNFFLKLAGSVEGAKSYYIAEFREKRATNQKDTNVLVFEKFS